MALFVMLVTRAKDQFLPILTDLSPTSHSAAQISQTGNFNVDDDDKNNDNRHTNRLLLAHAHEVIMYTYIVLMTSQDCNTQKETTDNIIRGIHDIEYLEHCQ